jgi:hypothetical protein
MEMQQMMELLLKEIITKQEKAEANQKKAEADRKADKEEMKADRKADQEKAEADRKAAQDDLMAKLDANQAKADADRVQMQEFMKTLQAYQAKTDAVLPAIQLTQTSRKETTAVIKPNEVETMACQGMEARQIEEKPASLDKKPEAAQQEEVPLDDAEVIPVREPKKKKRRDRKLAAEHRRQKTKTSPRENCGPQTRLAVTRRGTTRRAKVARKMQADQKMSRRATVARRKRDIVKSYLPQEKCHSRRGLTTSRTRTTHRAEVARRNKSSVGKNRTRWRQLIRRRGNKETKIRDFEDQLLLGSKWEMNKTLRRGNERETTKKINTSPTRLQRSKHWTLWKGRPPPKRKKGNGPYGRNRW